MAITRKCRQTGTLVTVGRSEELGLDDDEGNRWWTLCEPHGFLISHETRALAISWASDPLTWCERCNGSDPETD